MRWSFMRQFVMFLALVAAAVILWIDVATGLWQDYVILGGLAAGLVTFVLTTFVIDRVIARSVHEQWAPVTHLALTDIVYALADENASEIAHGTIVPRSFRAITKPDSADPSLDEQLRTLREELLAERIRLTQALASWSAFLAASADARDVLDHAAEVARRFDVIRDLSLDIESNPSRPALDELNKQIVAVNTAMRNLIDELHGVLQAVAERADDELAQSGRP